MADLITDAKELTKALARCTDERNTSCEGCPYYSTKESCKSRKKALLIIEFLLNEIEKLKEQQHWIPISERNPHTSGTYIVAIRVFEGDDKYILSSACYFDGSDTWYNDNRLNHERPYVNDKIIAWMSLPEPPKDGEHS